MKCWHCDTELIWLTDHDFEDEHKSYSMVTNLCCPNCDCRVDVYYPKKDEEELNDFVEGKDVLRHFGTEELNDLIKQTTRGLIIIDARARHRITGTDDPSIALHKVIKMLNAIDIIDVYD